MPAPKVNLRTRVDARRTSSQEMNERWRKSPWSAIEFRMTGFIAFEILPSIFHSICSDCPSKEREGDREEREEGREEREEREGGGEGGEGGG